MNEFISTLDPRLIYAVIAITTGGVVFAWRKISLESFDRLPARWQSLPAIIIGAALAAMAGTPGANFGAEVVNAIVGALMGLAAVGGHTAIKQVSPPAPTTPPAESAKDEEAK